MRFNKDIIVNKSKYHIVDNIRLQAYIQRINKDKYDIQVIENDKQYKILVTNKIERA